jgi:ribosomal protein L16/L10AE
VEVRTVEATIAELEAAQNEAHRTVTEQLGVRADSDMNITKNRARIYVTDEEGLENAMRQAGEELPEHLAVVEVRDLGGPD